MVTTASRIYEGWVRHRRFAPMSHSFTYRIFMLYLDLEEVASLPLPGWLWSTKKSALVTFRRDDHFGDPTQPLDEVVRDEVQRQIGHRPSGPIRVLTHARTLGYVFNPISIYYCFNTQERLESLLLEVTNTPWGEKHCYALPAEEVNGAAWRKAKSWAKSLHVSPFLPMTLSYRFLWTEPAASLLGHIECVQEGKGVLDATLSLESKQLTTAQLLRSMTRFPFLTLRVIAAIHWQAIRLWLKRVPLFDHPGPVAQGPA